MCDIVSSPFSHEMTSIVQKKLIFAYIFSTTNFFGKFKENFWIFYLYG